MTSNISDQSVVPDRLLARDQWICWREEDRNGKTTKVPVDPSTGGFASATDESTWASFDAAIKHATAGEAAGVGYVFDADGPFVGVDLDDCRDPETGRPSSRAKSVVNQLESYTEVSPSGTGYHVLVEGSLPDGRNRKGGVEMYDDARFFTVTGDHVSGTPPEIYPHQDALAAVHQEYVQPDSASASNTEPHANPDRATENQGQTQTDLADSEILEKASQAKNGEKFERLWSGQTSGYESHSEADMALCSILAFWTGGDSQQMDRLFRQSDLIREKWDEVHYGDGATYGEKTIRRAIQGTSTFYDPNYRSEEATTESSAASDGNHPNGDSGGASDETVSAQPKPTAESTAQSRLYREKTVRLLNERIDTLESKLHERNRQIASLEEEVQELEQALEQGSSQDVRGDDHGEETTSLLTRVRGLF